MDNKIQKRLDYLRSIKNLQIDPNLPTRDIAKLLTGCDDEVVDLMSAFTNHEPLIVPYYEDNGEHRKCHVNAEKTAKKLNGKPVKGWLMFQYLRLLDETSHQYKISLLEAGVSELCQHVLVKLPGGTYIDPTPVSDDLTPFGILRVFWPDSRVMTDQAKSYIKNKITGFIGLGENIIYIPKDSQWFIDKYQSPEIEKVIAGTLSNLTTSNIPDDKLDLETLQIKQAWDIFYKNEEENK